MLHQISDATKAGVDDKGNVTITQRDPGGEREMVTLTVVEFKTLTNLVASFSYAEVNEMLEDKHFKYLDQLRDSAVTNMYGTRPYLMKEFGLTRIEAQSTLRKWMNTFEERHPPGSKVTLHKSRVRSIKVLHEANAGNGDVDDQL